MHYAKYNKGAVGSILLHSNRGIDYPDEHEHSNENIDRSRTHLNYDLKDRNGQTAYEYYKQRINDIAAETKERTGKNLRKDAVTLCSWVLTAPKDLPENIQEEFFKSAYKWFSERYGADNIVTAAVHLDETSPHMHLQFTPIIEKDGVRKLCAKDMETRSTLQTAHQKLQKHLQQVLGCEVNIINGATENGNKSILELQNETLERRNTELMSIIKSLESAIKALKEQGITYLTGNDTVEKNVHKAVFYFEKLAAVGDSSSMVHLAECYSIGNGVRKDIQKAFDWYKKAADKGNIIGIKETADRLFTGTGTDKDYAEAANYYKMAADIDSDDILSIKSDIAEKYAIMSSREVYLQYKPLADEARSITNKDKRKDFMQQHKEQMDKFKRAIDIMNTAREEYGGKIPDSEQLKDEVKKLKEREKQLIQKNIPAPAPISSNIATKTINKPIKSKRYER